MTPEDRERERVAADERHFAKRLPRERQLVPTRPTPEWLLERTPAELVELGVYAPGRVTDGRPR